MDTFLPLLQVRPQIFEECFDIVLVNILRINQGYDETGNLGSDQTNSRSR